MSIENFIKTRYYKYLPDRVFITILNGLKYAVIAPLTKSIFMNIGMYGMNKYSREQFKRCLVHEYTHIYQSKYYNWGISNKGKEKSIIVYYQKPLLTLRLTNI